MKRRPAAGVSIGRWWLVLLAVSVPFVLTLIVPQAARAQKAWAPIPCSQSGVSTAAMKKCYKGPVAHGSSGTCAFNQYSAWGATAKESTYAYAFILDAGVNFRCYVFRDTKFRTDFPGSLPLLVKYSSEWSSITHIGDVTGMYFDFPKRHCFAYYFLGRRWNAGYESSTRGFVCGALGKSALTVSEIQEFIGSVRIRSQ